MEHDSLFALIQELVGFARTMPFVERGLAVFCSKTAQCEEPD